MLDTNTDSLIVFAGYGGETNMYNDVQQFSFGIVCVCLFVCVFVAHCRQQRKSDGARSKQEVHHKQDTHTRVCK